MLSPKEKFVMNQIVDVPREQRNQIVRQSASAEIQPPAPYLDVQTPQDAINKISSFRSQNLQSQAALTSYSRTNSFFNKARTPVETSSVENQRYFSPTKKQ